MAAANKITGEFIFGGNSLEIRILYMVYCVLNSVLKGLFDIQDTHPLLE